MDFSDVSENSKKLYISNLVRLNGGKVPKTIAFLKKTDVVGEKLMTYKPNTRRTYIIPILKLFKDNKVKKYYNFYYKMLMDISNPDNTEKTEKEVTNWIEPEMIANVEKKLDDKSVEYLIFSLYTKTAPRRSLDYANMVVGKPTDDNTKNYYYRGKFYFNRFKTAKTYGQQIVDVPAELDKIIQHHAKEGEPLLPSMNSVKMTRMLNKIFGKKISVNMLRKYYVTTKYGDTMKELKDDASDMGTSVGTLKNNYIKK
jgi:hypothetical protein